MRVIEENFRNVPGDQRRKMVCGNVIDFFSPELDAARVKQAADRDVTAMASAPPDTTRAVALPLERRRL